MLNVQLLSLKLLYAASYITFLDLQLEIMIIPFQFWLYFLYEAEVLS